MRSFIALAVLLLALAACGVPQEDYDALKAEHAILGSQVVGTEAALEQAQADLAAEQAQGAELEAQARATAAAHKHELEARDEAAGLVEADLRAALGAEREAKERLAEQVAFHERNRASLVADHAAAQTALQKAQDAYRDLEAQAGTSDALAEGITAAKAKVESLGEQVLRLEAKIRELDAQLAPLQTAASAIRAGRWGGCTGSMDPTLTCADRAYYAPFDPERVGVGAIVGVRASCSSEPSSRGTIVHRVTNIRVDSDGKRSYVTKGDSVRGWGQWKGHDHCIAPEEAVVDYVVKIEKNAYPERVWFVLKVRAAREAFHAADQFFLTHIKPTCGLPYARGCSAKLPDGTWVEAGKAAAERNGALKVWRCWLYLARNQGHLKPPGDYC